MSDSEINSRLIACKRAKTPNSVIFRKSYRAFENKSETVKKIFLKWHLTKFIEKFSLKFKLSGLANNIFYKCKNKVKNGLFEKHILHIIIIFSDSSLEFK